MKSDAMHNPEQGLYTQPVDPRKENELFDELYLRGTFDDDTVVIPETGVSSPEIIFALSYATQSLLIYFDGELTYIEGQKGAKADDHATIFMDVTLKESDDPQGREIA